MIFLTGGFQFQERKRLAWIHFSRIKWSLEDPRVFKSQGYPYRKRLRYRWQSARRNIYLAWGSLQGKNSLFYRGHGEWINNLPRTKNLYDR